MVNVGVTVSTEIDGTLIGVASSMRGLCYAEEAVLSCWSAPTIDGDIADPVPGLLPFCPVTICAHDDVIFAACNDAVALISAVPVNEPGTDALLLRSALPPAGIGLFSLITFSTFSPCGSLVAMTNRSQVVLISTPTLDMHVFDTARCGHDSNAVALMAFCKDLLFTVSRVSALEAWDISSFVHSAAVLQAVQKGESNGQAPSVTLTKDGGILSASDPVTAISADGANDILFVGFSSGAVRILSLADHRGSVPLFAPLFHVFLKGRLDPAAFPLLMGSPKTPTPADCEDPKNLLLPPTDATAEPLAEATEVHSSVLAFGFVGADCIVVTSVGIIAVDRRSYAVTPLVPFEAVATLASVSSASGIIGVYSPFMRQLLQLRATRSLDGTANVVRDRGPSALPFQLPREGETNADTALRADWVHAGQLLPSSVTAPLQRKELAKDANAKPVTFGRPIKSSGYTSQMPWSVQQAAKAKAKAKLGKSQALASKPLFQYPMDCGPTTKELRRSSELLLRTPVHKTSINAVAFDAAGSFLVTGANDATANALKLPCVKYGADGYALIGHKSQVLAVDTSLDLAHPVVATGSFDGTFALWRLQKQREQPYVMHCVGREVKSVKFFYQDKFLAVSSGSSIGLYKYLLDDGGDALHRQRNDSSVVAALSITSAAQSVVAFDCYNAFVSNVIVYAGSNKAVVVHDIQADKALATFPDAHARAIHSVETLRSSRYAEPGGDALHLFATAGLDKVVRLWDMRQQTPCRTLSTHSNGSVKVGLAWSPCGRFVAVGSEDRAVYLYDCGTGALLEKMPMSDVCSALRYHPTQALLAAACQDGTLRFFTEAAFVAD